MTFRERYRVQMERYYEGYVDQAMEFVADRRATGWFRDLNDFGSYYQRTMVPEQLFAFCAAWEIEEMTSEAA